MMTYIAYRGDVFKLGTPQELGDDETQADFAVRWEYDRQTWGLIPIVEDRAQAHTVQLRHALEAAHDALVKARNDQRLRALLEPR